MSREQELHAKFEDLRRDLGRLGIESQALPESYNMRDRLLFTLIHKAPKSPDSLEFLAWVWTTFASLYMSTSEFETMDEDQQTRFINSMNERTDALERLTRKR